jgi:hypothetical protein
MRKSCLIRHLAALAAALVLAGCGLPYLQIRQQLSPLQGQPLSAAVAKLGNPDGESQMFGKRVVEWKRQPAVDKDGDDQECVVRAFMRGDIIEEIRFTGDEAQCYRYAETLGNS